MVSARICLSFTKSTSFSGRTPLYIYNTVWNFVMVTYSFFKEEDASSYFFLVVIWNLLILSAEMKAFVVFPLLFCIVRSAPSERVSKKSNYIYFLIEYFNISKLIYGVHFYLLLLVSLFVSKWKYLICYFHFIFYSPFLTYQSTSKDINNMCSY